MKKLFVLALIMIFAIAPAMATNDKAVTVGGSRGTYNIMDYGDTSSDGTIELPTVKRALQQTKVLNLDLQDAYISGTGIISNYGTTSPGLQLNDSAPKIVWANSNEKNPVQWTFTLPNFNGGLVIKAMVSSSSTTDYTSHSYDWALLANSNSSVFGTQYAQDAVANTEANISVENAIITFTPDATAQTAITATTVNTLTIWPVNTVSIAASDEILHVWVEYY